MPQPRILLIGHSHVNCVQVAARAQAPTPWLKVVNLRRLENSEPIAEAVLNTCGTFEPDFVCLCLGGNFHNVVGLLEHPQPFNFGSPMLQDAPSEDQARHLVPRALMRALFLQKAHPELMDILFGCFSRAKRLVMNAPPPVADFAHIKNNPGVFAERIDQGPAPAELRLKLFDLQTEVFAELACDHGATFVTAPSHAKTANGFLSQRYANDDPTHGNAAYGAEMLNLLQTPLEVAA